MSEPTHSRYGRGWSFTSWVTGLVGATSSDPDPVAAADYREVRRNASEEMFGPRNRPTRAASNLVRITSGTPVTFDMDNPDGGLAKWQEEQRNGGAPVTAVIIPSQHTKGNRP